MTHMQTVPKKLVTIIAEDELEPRLTTDVKNLAPTDTRWARCAERGYTVPD
jgi:hypothetical protein